MESTPSTNLAMVSQSVVQVAAVGVGSSENRGNQSGVKKKWQKKRKRKTVARTRQKRNRKKRQRKELKAKRAAENRRQLLSGPALPGPIQEVWSAVVYIFFICVCVVVV
jgi:hypothetical protein